MSKQVDQPVPDSDFETSTEAPRRVTKPKSGLLGGLAIRCHFCPGTSFRRSRFRAKDLRRLLLFQYPVRCLRCSQRQYVSFTVAGLSIASRVRHQRPPRPDETWMNWTNEEEAPRQRKASARPLTTSQVDTSPPAAGTLPRRPPVKVKDDDSAIW